jgi:antitoxin component HigA of HigAB toxin-antitoxin module
LAREWARKYARDEPDAIKEVDKLLDAARLDINEIEDSAKEHRAEELAEAYARREPDVLKKVTNLLASSGRTMDDLMASAVAENADSLTSLERLDHLITVAEARRNAMLREIDRHRAALGEALRRNLQEVEGKFTVIEKMPAEAMSAA